jgi:putative aldouronate transport system permease protein
MRNTFAMSTLGIMTSWLPLIFAVFLSELKSIRFKKFVQTFTTIPNFVSWVLVYSLAYSLFSSSGMINHFLLDLNLIQTPILFLQSDSHTWLSMWLWGTWKTLGWSSIMYIAAISGIDQEMYEAAKVDGAKRLQLIRYITIPSLLPTYFILLMLSVANFLNNGMDQYYVFYNSFNSSHIQVLDLFVYNLGLKSGGYSIATAISMLKSFVSITLLFIVNQLSKLLRGESMI